MTESYQERHAAEPTKEPTPLWQKAATAMDPDSPEYRFGKRLYDLHRDAAASVGCDEEEWINLDPIDQWIVGTATIALIESLEDVEVIDTPMLTYRGVDTIEPL